MGEEKTMVKMSTFYTCGCGYNTEIEKEAKEHVKTTGHKMDLKGMVTP
jgi:hypothetical protein